MKKKNRIVSMMKKAENDGSLTESIAVCGGPLAGFVVLTKKGAQAKVRRSVKAALARVTLGDQDGKSAHDVVETWERRQREELLRAYREELNVPKAPAGTLSEEAEEARDEATAAAERTNPVEPTDEQYRKAEAFKEAVNVAGITECAKGIVGRVVRVDEERTLEFLDCIEEMRTKPAGGIRKNAATVAEILCGGEQVPSSEFVEGVTEDRGAALIFAAALGECSVRGLQAEAVSQLYWREIARRGKD